VRAATGVRPALALVDELRADEVDAEDGGRPAATERRPDWAKEDFGEREEDVVLTKLIGGAIVRCWAGSFALSASASARDISWSSSMGVPDAE
jgi:hypothetical protein